MGEDGDERQTTDTSQDEASQEADEAPPEAAQEQDGELPSREDLQARVLEAEDHAEELEARVDELTNTLARVQADYDNYRKRVKRQKAEARRDARIEVLKIIVEGLDDLRRARSAASEQQQGTKLDEGLKMVEKRLTRGLEDLGVEALEPEPGDSFQPDSHEALMNEVTDEVPDGSVAETLQAGYRLDGKLVRPALVKVAKAPEADEA